MPVHAAEKVKVSDLGEFGLIDLIKKQAGRFSSVVQGIGDDAAVISLSSKKYLLLTTDMLVEDVHFTRAMPAKAVGHKAIAVSISDVAAMGGVAKYAVVSLGLPPSCSRQFVSQLYQGITATAKKFNVGIVGGDTVRSKRIVINIALTGEVRRSAAVYRKGARPGDQIFVTGPLGKSLSTGWHLRFVPRLAEAQYLLKYKPTAMIDVSDGLAGDLGHILAESRVGAVLDEGLIPRRRNASLKEALYDGEDFELLFTLSPTGARRLQSQGKKKFSCYRVGEIVQQRKGLQLKTLKGNLKRLEVGGYTHF